MFQFSASTSTRDVKHTIDVKGTVVMTTFSVDQELWEVEELGDELLYVSHGLVRGQAPRGVHGVKRPVRDIKALV